MRLTGKLGPGNGTTSGRNGKFPGGTIRLQKPHMAAKLEEQGHDGAAAFVSGCYNAALHVYLDWPDKRRWRLVAPTHHLTGVSWYRGIRWVKRLGLTIPTWCNKTNDTFALTSATLHVGGNAVPVLFYVPAAKVGEVAWSWRNSMELLSLPLEPGLIAPGTEVVLELPNGCVELVDIS